MNGRGCRGRGTGLTNINIVGFAKVWFMVVKIVQCCKCPNFNTTGSVREFTYA